jgi:hypothetical protein
MIHGLGVILGLSLVFLDAGRGGAQPATSASDSGPYTRVANATFRSCGYAVLDHYWLAVARCNDVADADDRAACLEAARDERTEANKL